MTANEKKVELLKEMVANGYHLCGRTYKDYCRDFSLEDIENFHRCYMTRNYPV